MMSALDDWTPKPNEPGRSVSALHVPGARCRNCHPEHTRLSTTNGVAYCTRCDLVDKMTDPAHTPGAAK